MIKPIRIIIQDFPKTFPLSVESFLGLITKVRSRLKILVGFKTNIGLKSSARAHIKERIQPKSDIGLGCKLTPHSCIGAATSSTLELKNHITGKIATHAKGSTVMGMKSSVKAIVAIFLRWTDREVQTWADVETMTCEDFIMREIK